MKKIILIAAAFALFPFGAQAVELDADTNGYLDADKGGRNAALGTAAEAATGDFDAAGAAAAVIAAAVTESDTTHCPDGASVFTALAGKMSTSDSSPLTFTSDGLLGSLSGNWVTRYLSTDFFSLATDTWILKDASVTAAKLGTDADDDAIEFVIDGGGSAITTGVKGCLEIPWAATISAALVTAPIESGSISIDLWVDSYANFPPTDADSITASAPIAMTTAQTGNSALTGWTVAVTKGQWVCFNVDSVTSTTLATVSLKVDK